VKLIASSTEWLEIVKSEWGQTGKLAHVMLMQHEIGTPSLDQA